MKYPEHIEQCLLISWARRSEGKYPELATLHSSLNAGRRRPAEAARLKAAGMLAGIPDVFLPAARSGAHGLYIEMKANGGSVTPIQRAMHDRLRENGYQVEVCYSFESAKSSIILYLSGEK